MHLCICANRKLITLSWLNSCRHWNTVRNISLSSNIRCTSSPFCIVLMTGETWENKTEVAFNSYVHSPVTVSCRASIVEEWHTVKKTCHEGSHMNTSSFFHAAGSTAPGKTLYRIERFCNTCGKTQLCKMPLTCYFFIFILFFFVPVIRVCSALGCFSTMFLRQ